MPSAHRFQSILALVVCMFVVTGKSSPAAGEQSEPTATPIKHVIVIIGENHSFDNMFAGFVPPRHQFVWNLLSEKIILPDGSPGTNATSGLQKESSDLRRYQIAPTIIGPFRSLPSPNDAGAIGRPPKEPDARFPARLPNAPFQITRYVPYLNAYVGSPVHRFFQMWQQIDQGRSDLFPWVGMTVGNGSDGNPPPTHFNTETTGQGSVSMGFYNMNTGDEPYLSRLSRQYSLADNYHQAIMGGTGANHILIGTADVAFFSRNGRPEIPPKDQIENPDPQKGGLVSATGIPEGNDYVNDGFGNTKTGIGGNYVECADIHQPGVRSIQQFLSSLPYPVFSPGGPGNCAPNTYYLVNNYDPAFNPKGKEIHETKHFLATPQTLPSIADSLSAHGISWGYFGQGWNHGNPTPEYCPHCNPFQFESSIMQTSLRQNLQGYKEFLSRLKTGTLPSVSFIKPGDDQNGHPAYSTLSNFERFVKKTVALVQSRPEIWKNTAIFITLDEGGGYYDSGYIQLLSFFGDGTRVPLIVVSPFAKKGFVDHTYYDHVSLIKFIEKNWHLDPLSKRSLDNLPNPIMPVFPQRPDLSHPDQVKSLYIPQNRPAIGDLTNLFDFSPQD
ncbi:MAG: alkaline phosphatase family protein [Leptospirales bacterium]